MPKFYITTSIPYVNAPPHIGHALEFVGADAIARWRRIQGDDVFFLTGTDEHGAKIARAAEAAGRDAQTFVDEQSQRFRDLITQLSIMPDDMIRTSDKERHWPGAVEMWKRMAERGDIYKGMYKGLYCVGHEAFVTEKDLKNGICEDHGKAPEYIEEENYFFKLSEYAGEVKRHIEEGYLEIVPRTRANEVLAFLREGVEDISFSRPAKDIPWGIPVPGDLSSTMYVWCDALSNYITALGYGRDDKLYKEFWPAQVHVIGKDILRFHAAIWPAMLLSAGLPLPKTLLVHGFITSGGKKMSKTLGNIIDPQELLEEYGTDAVRYFLARHITPFEDGDITRGSFKEIYNANLANGLGNLVARVMQLAETYLEQGVRPEVVGFPAEYTEALDKFEVNRALDFVFSRIQALDQTITQTEPFKLVKTDPEYGKQIVFDLTQELYAIGRMLNPFLPQTCEKIKTAVLANKKPENLFERKE